MKCEHNVNSECRLPAFPGDKLIAGNQNARQEHQDQQDRHQRSDADGIHNGGDRRILEKPAHDRRHNHQDQPGGRDRMDRALVCFPHRFKDARIPPVSV